MAGETADALSRTLQQFGVSKANWGRFLKHSQAAEQGLGVPESVGEAQMIHHALDGVPVSSEDLDLLAFEFRNSISSHAPSRKTTSSVAIVGGGLAGLIFAETLAGSGLEVTLFEKASTLGGTWYKNSYPGARVDITGITYWPSRFGAKIFAEIYPPRDQLLNGIADQQEKLLSKGAEIVPAQVLCLLFSEEKSTWRVTYSSEYQESSREFDFVVLAPGRLSQHSFEPQGSLTNKAQHVSSFLFGERDLERASGGNTIVVGFGASGIQAAVALSEISTNTSLVVREPAFIRNVPMLRRHTDDRILSFLSSEPLVLSMLRTRMSGQQLRGELDAVVIDQKWPRNESVSEANHELRNSLLNEMAMWFDGVLPQHLWTPSYPPGARRILLDDGSLARAVSEGRLQILQGRASPVANGVTLDNGATIEGDLVVWATGYRVGNLLREIEVIGRSGKSLTEVMGPNQASLGGVSVAGFPNLFLAHGPNSNVVVSGSNTQMIDIQAEHVRLLVERALESEKCAVDVGAGAMQKWHRTVTLENRLRAWGRGVGSWYQNPSGHVTENWPGSPAEYRSRLSWSRDHDYVFST